MRWCESGSARHSKPISPVRACTRLSSSYAIPSRFAYHTMDRKVITAMQELAAAERHAEQLQTAHTQVLSHKEAELSDLRDRLQTVEAAHASVTATLEREASNHYTERL